VDREQKKADLAKAFNASLIAEEAAMQHRAAINAIRKAIAYAQDGEDITTKAAILETLKQQQPELEREAVECGLRFDQISKELNST
jgi:hypothetical protein